MEMTRQILQVELLSKQFEHKNRLAYVRLFRSLSGRETELRCLVLSIHRSRNSSSFFRNLAMEGDPIEFCVPLRNSEDGAAPGIHKFNTAVHN
jgi:hypothetical protein